MKKIRAIRIKKILEESPDLSDLGTFSKEKGKFAIEHKGDRGTLPYFNADNVENMKQAKQNYERMMQFETGLVCQYEIKAEAEILTSSDKGQTWLINAVSSGGVWGIESDSDKEYFKEIADGELEELKDVLRELGFSQVECDQGEIDWGDL